MKVKTLQTNDFMGLAGKKVYDLSPQIVAMCEGNGRGKSSVLNALRYGLAGTKPDGEMITKGKKCAAVQVDFADGTSISRMEFTKQGKPAAYYVDQKRSTLSAINQKIVGMTGNVNGIPRILAASDLLRRLSPQEFGEVLLTYLPETMTADDVIRRVSGLTEPMKATIIEELPEGEFGAKELDKFYQSCVERRRQLKASVNEKKAFIDSYSNFQAPQETMEELKGIIEALEKQRDKAVAYAAAKREYDRLKKQADEHTKLIKRVEAEIGNGNAVTHTQEERNAAALVLEAHRSTEKVLYSSLHTLKSTAESLKKAIETIKQPVCPLSDKIACTTNKTIILNDLKQEYRKTAETYNAQLAEYKKEKEKAEKAEAELRKIDADNAEAKRIAGLKDNLKRLRETMPQVPEEPVPAGDAQQLASEISKNQQKVRYLQDAERIRVIKDQLKNHKEMLAKYDALANAFSPKGEAKAAIYAYYLGEFAEICNKKADKLFPGMALKFIPKDGVTVLVDTKGTGDFISIESLSEGEKAGVTFLIMSLLSNISGFRILILDELSVLDKKALEALLSILENNKDEFDLAILACVDHDDALRILKEKGITMISA